MAVLLLLGLALALSGCRSQPIPGDLDRDGDVDRDDLSIVLEALNTPASGSGDRRDLDGDGMITGLDARKLVLLCTLPGCAVPPKVTITSPEDGSLFDASPIDVTGEKSEEVEDVSVNGVPATLDGLSWSAAVPLQEGSNVIEAVATDGAGNAGTASIQVVLDTIPPALAITSPTAGEVVSNPQPSVALTYSDENGVDTGSLAFTANGSELPVACTLNQTGGSCTPSAPLAVGPVTLAATISDAAGNAGSAEVAFTIGAPPLSLTITEPAADQVFGASPIIVRGEVSDPSAVIRAGDVFATVSGTSFEATGVVITEGPNTLNARARDAARNEAQASRTVVLDTRPPILSILSPADRAVLTELSVPISGYVSDATALTATIDDAPAAVSDNELTGTAQLVGGENLVTVTCRDAAGNATTKRLTLFVDAVPLAVTDIAPADGELDVELAAAITATFSEPVAPASLAASSFFARFGASIVPAVLSVAPDGLSATLTPSSPLPSGAEIEITVTTGATDAAGNPLPSPFRSRFTTAGEPAEPGIVIGEVYDDTKSLPLEGASVVALDPATETVLAQTRTDPLGRYLLSPGRSDVVVRATGPGFTVVERAPTGGAGSFVEALDARLTPLAEARRVQAVLPAEVSTGAGDRLVIPPGALDGDGDVGLTEIGPQGARAPFPAGWTPLAIVDVAAPGPFDPPATLEVSDRTGLAAGRQAVAASYDPTAAVWRALGDVTMPSEGVVEVDEISGAGQFALLVADEGEGAPAPAVPGAPLAPGTAIPIPEDADGTGLVTPPVGLVSDATPVEAEVTITAGAPLRSGTVLLGDFFELFVLRDGAELTPLATSQDLTVHRALDDPDGQTLGTRFAISPSLVFSPLEATEGRITVTLRRRSLRARDVVGVAGGGVQAEDASRVIVPPAAFAADVPIRLASIAEQEFGVVTPEGLTFLGGLELDLAGVTPASGLSLTLGGRAAYVPTGGQVVVASIEKLPGRAVLVPVALARPDGEDLTTFTALGGASLPGIRVDGRYGFYLVPDPIALLEGTARDEAGRREGLAIRIEGLPFVSTTDASGRFVAVAPVGDFTLVATSASTLDAVRVAGTTGVPLAEVVVATTPPRVEQVTVRPPRVPGNFTGPVVLLGRPAPAIDDDASGASSGNGNGVIEAGERIELSLTVRNDGNVAVEGGLFLLDVRGPSGAVTVTPSSLPIGILAPDAPVEVGPFVLEIPAASDPAALRYTLSRFGASGGRPNDLFFTLPLDAEHVNVPVDSEISIAFSEPVEPDTLADGLTLTLEDPGGPVPVATKLLVAPDAASLRMRPLAPLADDATYLVTIGDPIVDRDGLALAGSPIVERIRTQDLTPPGPIDPGKIEASVPDEEGLVTVIGSLGSVNPEDTVIVLNESTGFVSVATVAADGSFTAEIPAGLSDRLQLISLDISGNEVTTDLAGFVRRDPTTGEVLSVVVGRDGAVVEGPDGISLDVPTGAVAGAAELAVARSDVPFELPVDLASEPAIAAAFGALFSVVERIEIEASVARFAAPVALSLPAPTGAQAGDLYLVARSRVVTIGGALADLDRSEGLTAAENPLRSVERLEIVDSATVKSAGTGLVLSTDSPPFGGIEAPGTLTVLEPAAPLTFLSGEVRRDTAAGRPVIGAVVQSLPDALATAPFAAVTDEEGRFVVADETAGGPYADGAVVASRLDVSDPLFARVIRRDVRGVVGEPAPPGTVIAQLQAPFVLPSRLPAAVIEVLGDLEPPTVEIRLAGSSLGQGYAALGDRLTISVVAEDDDQVTFVGLEVDEGGALESVPLAPDGSYALVPFAPGLIQLRARAQDRTGNTTFVDRTVLVVSLTAGGAVVPPAADPDRPPDLIEPPGRDEGDGPQPVPPGGSPSTTQVSFDGEVVLCFSEPLDPSTVNDSTLRLLDPEGAPVDLDLSTDFNDSCIRILPLGYLRLGGRYELRGDNVLDTDGEPAGRAGEGGNGQPRNIRETLEVPPPFQVQTTAGKATLSLPNVTDVALVEEVKLGADLLTDVLAAVSFPLRSDDPGEIQLYQLRDEEDPDLLLLEPPLVGSTTAKGNPWSLAVDGTRAYVGNAWLGDIVFLEGTVSYTENLYGVFNIGTGILHTGYEPSLGYRRSGGPSPPSNLEVFDLSDPTKPTSEGGWWMNFGNSADYWDPNTLPTRVEITERGLGVLNLLDNVEFFDLEPPFSSLGVVESIWGPGVRAGRCQGGPEDGALCPKRNYPPFLQCVGAAECQSVDEFYDAAFLEGSEARRPFAAVLQRDEVRLAWTDDRNNPFRSDPTISKIPATGAHFGRVGAVSGFQYEDANGDRQTKDLVFVSIPRPLKRLTIFDVTDPESPVELSTLFEAFGNMSFDECRGLAYLHGPQGEFHIIDFNDPERPRELNDPGFLEDPFRIEGLGATVSYNGNANHDHLVVLAEEAGVSVVQTRVCSPLDPEGNAAPPLVSVSGNAVTGSCEGEVLRFPWRQACRPVDLDIEKVPDSDEISIGGIVLVNDDDDDLDGNKDNTQTEQAEGEDDLIEITLSIRNPEFYEEQGAQVTLDITAGFGVRIWDENGDLSALSWLPSEVPDRLFVEGLIRSTEVLENELTLTLSTRSDSFEDRVSLTVGEISLEPITVEPLAPSAPTVEGSDVERVGFPVYNPSGVELGRTARFRMDVVPAIPDEHVLWTAELGGLEVLSQGVSEDGLGHVVDVKGLQPGEARLRASIRGYPRPPPTIDATVLERAFVPLRMYIVCEDEATVLARPECAIGADELPPLVAGLNRIYEQVALEFVQIGPPEYIFNSEWIDLCCKSDKRREARDLGSYAWNTGGVEVYFVATIDGAVGVNRSVGDKTDSLWVSANSNFDVLAHEIGHAADLDDIYAEERLADGATRDPQGGLDEIVREEWAPKDWNGGPGPQYYGKSKQEGMTDEALEQEELLQRALMYGEFSDFTPSADITRGKLRGWGTNGLGDLSVGLDGMKNPQRENDRRPEHW